MLANDGSPLASEHSRYSSVALYAGALCSFRVLLGCCCGGITYFCVFGLLGRQPCTVVVSSINSTLFVVSFIIGSTRTLGTLYDSL